MEKILKGNELFEYFEMKSRRINRTYPYYFLCLEFFPLYELPEMIDKEILNILRKSFNKLLKKVDGAFIDLKEDKEKISIIATFKVFRNVPPSRVANHIKMSSSRDLKKNIPNKLPQEIQILIREKRYWATPYNVLNMDTLKGNDQDNYFYPSEPIHSDFFKQLPKK